MFKSFSVNARKNWSIDICLFISPLRSVTIRSMPSEAELMRNWHKKNWSENSHVTTTNNWMLLRALFEIQNASTYTVESKCYAMLYRTLLLLLVVSSSLHYLPIWMHGLSALPRIHSFTHSLTQTHIDKHAHVHVHAHIHPCERVRSHSVLMLIPRFWFGIRMNEQFPCNRRTLAHSHTCKQCEFIVQPFRSSSLKRTSQHQICGNREEVTFSLKNKAVFKSIDYVPNVTANRMKNKTSNSNSSTELIITCVYLY